MGLFNEVLRGAFKLGTGGLLGLLLVASAAGAAESGPAQVHVGVYVNQIYAVSLKDNQFSVDFFVWFRWTDEQVKPLETFDVANGRIESKSGEFQDTVEGMKYAICRVDATITKFWDISRFPLDNHVLTLEIEDNDNEEFKLEYILDQENCGMNPQVQVPGWRVTTPEGQVVPHAYRSNYGDISLPTGSESVYSRLVYSVPIERPGYGYFGKLFFGLFVAVLIAFLCFFIKPTDLDPRFGLGVGAVFAAVASEYIIMSALPDSNVLTMADMLHILAFACIFACLAESTLSLKLYTSGRESASKRLDFTCGVLFACIFLALSSAVVFMGNLSGSSLI